ncbi:MAG TPA: hypothetical protein ENG06_01720 [Thermoplasmatales archaeon]|nr:hypothetical protein [Thermoplasmatales archaeon]
MRDLRSGDDCMKPYPTKIAVLIIVFFMAAGTHSLLPVRGDDTALPPHTDFADDTVELSFHLDAFDMHEVIIDGTRYYAIDKEKESSIHEKGLPELPKICRSIIIPDDKKMAVRVISAAYIEYEDILIAPSKGFIERSIDPDDVPYEFAPIYKEDIWFPGEIATLQEPYILRDFRGQTVEIYPYQYNPVQHKLRFYHDVVIEVYAVGEGEINVYNRERPLTSPNPYFVPIYTHHFVNYETVVERLNSYGGGGSGTGGAKYTPVSDAGNMLIICYDGFYATMQPFVQWKNMKGIPTEIVNVSAVGGTASAIKSYISNYYSTNGLTFVLLVGDIQQIPTLTSYGASDPSYGYVAGSDHYADLFVGRFSAQTVSQLQTQIERSIEYEKYPQAGADWYRNGTGIASSQGPGDDGEYDYQHIRNIRSALLAYTYITVDEFYDGSQGGEDAPGNPSATAVAAAINNGRSIINYCGHGSATSWSTSGFSNTNVNSLVNDNMLPFIVSVACNNGEFDNYDTCFAEAWMRATHNGEPTGAIGIFASSISQDWSPPMDVQDEVVDILVETYPSNIKTTTGGLVYNGCAHMLDNYGSSGYKTVDTWILFGDPSLELRTDTPSPMTVTHNPLMYLIDTSFDVTVNGVPHALCALSRNGTLLAYNYTDANGETTLHLNVTLNSTESLTLVVTAKNKIPYMANITVLGELNFTLYSGWNLITIPVENNYTASSLAALIPECDMIAWWSAQYGMYITFIVGVTPPGSPWDFNITDGVSYYVSVTNDSYLTVNGTPLNDVNVTLYPGWNTIGWWKTRATTASVLASQITDCEIVAMWDAASGSYTTFIVGITPPGSPWDFTVDYGMGLLVKVSTGGIWTGA